MNAARVVALVVATLTVAGGGPLANVASAQETVTVVSFGGGYQDAERKAMYEPAAKRLGMTIKEDSLKGIADVRLQVQSGKPTWDVVELGKQYCMADEARDLFEPLDFRVITNAADLDAKLKGERWVGGPVFYSYVLAWNKDKYGNNPPKTWKDFFDVQKFPGTRALYGQARFMLELALLGDGVPRDKVYPIDVDRAMKKLDGFKQHITAFYTSHGQSVQMVKDREIDMLVMTDGRADGAIKDGARLDFTYNDGIIDAGCLAIPRGAPNRTGAMKVINEFIAADIQANIPLHFSYGPINPKAFAIGKIPPDLARKLNSSPEHLKLQLLLDSAWWASNEKAVQPRWDAFLQK
jgi:putative spermidine/putrescine transport system substrate-binding protein